MGGDKCDYDWRRIGVVCVMIHVKHYSFNRDLELFIVFIERIWMILDVMWF